ncbi:hypothetical protein [Tomitella biformata]|uniref:hypothetical protein n=1 Tax=Tomitella biformata TaxID=630403 RepID=UPI0004BCEA0F|nr:hypothetical protein [Tomitella biformata]
MYWTTDGDLPDEAARALRSAAFGPLRGEGRVVLPAARCGRELWWRAVAHGGLGYYARAEADLGRLRAVARRGGGGPCASLEASTRASLLRQMGRHGLAAEHDGRALALAGPANLTAIGMLQARADALTGLAADSLGRAGHRTASRLLEACAEELGGPPSGPGDPLWRARLRLLWVRAETAMAAGDAETALANADAARAYAESVDSERHQVKTLLIGAAAAAVSGQAALSAQRADEVLEWAGRARLLPLRWAACMLLQGVAPSEGVAGELARCEAELQCRGGHPD